MQCIALTKAGTRCSRPALPNSEYCWQHDKKEPPEVKNNLISDTSLVKLIQSPIAEQLSEINPQRLTFLKKKYRLFRKLGEGTYGVVILAESRETKENVAIKIMDLVDQSKHQDGLANDILSEISVLQRTNHPNLIKIYEILYNPEKTLMGLVLELAGSDLKYLISEVWFKPGIRNRKTEQVKKQLQLAYDIFCGTNYLHVNGLIHLDLKPANILIKNNHAKIADFGLADRTDGGKAFGPSKATWPYRAPELHCESSTYDYNVDTWSIGIMLSELFFNHNLVYKKGYSIEEDLYFNIEKKIGTPSKDWFKKYSNDDSQYCEPSGNVKDIYKDLEKSIFSDPNIQNFYKTEYYGLKVYNDIIDLIKRCLRLDPKERIQFQDVVKHPLFQNLECNCIDCLIVAGYHIPLDAPALDSKLENSLSKDDKLILPYAREIFRRLKKYKFNVGIEYQIAVLSISGKFLNIQRIRYKREDWMKISGIKDVKELNNLELEVAETLNFNFDGPEK